MAPLARNVLVTRSNRGIGLEPVRQLVEGPDPPEHIFLPTETWMDQEERYESQEFLPLLKRAAEEAGKEGLSCSKAAIINMSTQVGSIELCFEVLEIPMYPYCASKATLNMVTRCLAAELKDAGILCTAIHPGWVKTDIGTEKVVPSKVPGWHADSASWEVYSSWLASK